MRSTLTLDPDVSRLLHYQLWQLWGFCELLRGTVFFRRLCL
jgi:hypothetical protein